MAKIEVQVGSTSVRVWIFIQDSSVTTGAGLTGLTSGSSGLVCYRARDDDGNAGGTQLSLSAGTRGTWSSGGFVEKDATNLPGLYELGLDNAGLATGSRTVVYILKGATNMVECPLEIELTAVNNQSATSFITGVNGLAPPANWNLSSQIIVSGTASAGGASTITLAGASATNNLYNQCVVFITGGTGAGQAAVVNNYVGSTKVATISGTWVTNPDATSTFVVLANPLGRVWDEVNTGATHNVNNSSGKQLRTISPGSSDIIRTGTAQAGGASTITLDAGASAVNQAYQFDIISITSGTGAGQSKYITNYVGSTKVATVNSAWSSNPDNTSVFEITPTSVSQVISYATGQDPGTLVVNQPIGASPWASTLVSDSLKAAWSQGIGKWTIVGTTLTLYAPDGTTVVKAFTLDSATAPTSRT